MDEEAVETPQYLSIEGRTVLVPSTDIVDVIILMRRNACAKPFNSTTSKMFSNLSHI
jgi:hypothetical protein